MRRCRLGVRRVIADSAEARAVETQVRGAHVDRPAGGPRDHRVSTGLARQGRDGRHRPDHAARAPGHGLRRARRPPPITGLYTSIMCLLAYAVFGPSRILVLGPDSSLGPMIAATVLPLVAAGGDPGRAVAVAAMLALMTAVVMIAAGALGLGFVADLLSKPTMIGYMNGLALTIVVGQLPKLFGFSVDADGLIREFVGFLG